MNLAEKIRDAISEISDKIKAAFADVDFGDNVPVFEAARAIENVMDRAQALWDKALEAATENYNAAQATGMKAEGGVQYQRSDITIDSGIQTMVTSALNHTPVRMTQIATISSVENKAINRLSQRTDEYRGKYTGGKHLVSGHAVEHSISEHGNTMREALRGQLPLTEDDIVLTLSAIKNGQARVYAPGHTKAGKPSIIQSVPINGYTLYTEEISRKSKDGVSDLIGHTIWKAPTLSTAAGSGTSPVPLPRRQSTMLSEYSISQNGQKSTVQFVAGKDGKAAQLYYEDNNGALNKDHLLGGLILLSGDSTVIDNASDGGTTVQGYALMKKPFVITEGHKVFTNSETDVALKLSELKKQGYDGFIFDYHEGDRYAVMVFNDAQVVTPAEFANYQKKQQFQKFGPDELQAKYDSYIDVGKELTDVRNQIRTWKNTADFKRIMDDIGKAEGDAIQDAIQAYKDWEDASGFGALYEREKELSERYDRLRKEYEAMSLENERETEREQMEKAGKSEADYYRDKAVKEFGYTPYYYDAGYIVPNGKMLNFSDEKGRHFGSRGQDHRAIGTIFTSDISGSEAMLKFMEQGNIRIMAETPGIDINNKVGTPHFLLRTGGASLYDRLR